MFTGIVSDVGEVLEFDPLGERSRLVIGSTYDPASIALGASIAIDGVCLTVIEVFRAATAPNAASTSARRRSPSPRRSRFPSERM